jgi:putative hydrolase of the HAD superfamily
MPADVAPSTSTDAAAVTAAAGGLVAATSLARGPRLGAELDAVLFDAGGVMLVPDPLTIGPALAPFGGTTDIGALVRGHYVAMRAHAGSDEDGPGRWLDALRAFVAAVGVPDERADEAMGAMVRVFGHRTWRFPLVETIIAMERMRDLGTPMGVVSNADGQIEGILLHQLCCQVGPGGGVPVDVIVDSGIVGVEKPDPAVFAPALEVLAGLGATDPSRIGFVGDSAVYDVEGARNAGLLPLLLDPYDLHGDLDLGDDVHRIASVHDLLPLPAAADEDPAHA